MHIDWICEKDANVINGTSISKSRITKLIAKNFFTRPLDCEQRMKERWETEESEREEETGGRGREIERMQGNFRMYRYPYSMVGLTRDLMGITCNYSSAYFRTFHMRHPELHVCVRVGTHICMYTYVSTQAPREISDISVHNLTYLLAAHALSLLIHISTLTTLCVFHVRAKLAL